MNKPPVFGKGSRIERSNPFALRKPNSAGPCEAGGCLACRPKIAGLRLSEAEERVVGVLSSFDWNEGAARKLILLKRAVFMTGDSAVTEKMDRATDWTVLREKKAGLEISVSVSEGSIRLSASHYAPENGGNYFYHSLCEGVFSVFSDASISIKKKEGRETPGMCTRSLEALLIARPVRREFAGC